MINICSTFQRQVVTLSVLYSTRLKSDVQHDEKDRVRSRNVEYEV